MGNWDSLSYALATNADNTQPQSEDFLLLFICLSIFDSSLHRLLRLFSVTKVSFLQNRTGFLLTSPLSVSDVPIEFEMCAFLLLQNCSLLSGKRKKKIELEV